MATYESALIWTCSSAAQAKPFDNDQRSLYPAGLKVSMDS